MCTALLLSLALASPLTPVAEPAAQDEWIQATVMSTGKRETPKVYDIDASTEVRWAADGVLRSLSITKIRRIEWLTWDMREVGERKIKWPSGRYVKQGTWARCDTLRITTTAGRTFEAKNAYVLAKYDGDEQKPFTILQARRKVIDPVTGDSEFAPHWVNWSSCAWLEISGSKGRFKRCAIDERAFPADYECCPLDGSELHWSDVEASKPEGAKECPKCDHVTWASREKYCPIDGSRLEDPK